MSNYSSSCPPDAAMAHESIRITPEDALIVWESIQKHCGTDAETVGRMMGVRA
jgi:hypothetical protein